MELEDMTLEEIDRKIKEINKKGNLTKELKEELSKLRIERMYVASPAIYNDVLDLRLPVEERKNYLIFLHNTRIWVGSINYRGYHCSDFSGDVECSIAPYFQGNGYAYQALKLLGEKLYDEKVFDIWVSAYKDNLASIKTIEKYGGKQIKPQSHSNKDVLLFECKTLSRETNKKQGELQKSDKNNCETER